MPDSYKRSESLLDLEHVKEDPIIKQNEQMQSAISQTTLEQLGTVLEMSPNLGIGKM